MKSPSQAYDMDLPCHGGPVSLVAHQLPFTVKVVRTEHELMRVCRVRAIAYERHMPGFGVKLSEPEVHDRAPGNVILIAEDKQTGEAVGTMRMHTNMHQRLPLQAAASLPLYMQRQLLVEVCRFSVKPGYSNGEVRQALFKALYLYCHASQAQYMVVAARRPLNEIYKSLGFKALHGGEEQWVPLSYAGGRPHSLLSFNVPLAEQLWQDIDHPLYDFMRRTYHPDIQVLAGMNSIWNHARPVAEQTVDQVHVAF